MTFSLQTLTLSAGIAGTLALASCAAPSATMNHGAGSVSMDDMALMLEGKTGDAFDKAFLEGMIPHHQGAIDMANDALKYAKHEELKALATAIIASQQREIDQMKQWQKDWGYTQQ